MADKDFERRVRGSGDDEAVILAVVLSMEMLRFRCVEPVAILSSWRSSRPNACDSTRKRVFLRLPHNAAPKQSDKQALKSQICPSSMSEHISDPTDWKSTKLPFLSPLD